MELVFATNNLHKLEEIRCMAPGGFTVLSLKDIQCFQELPETQNTLEGNASQKAFFIYNQYKRNCFADDTGLEIDSLNGAPGVYSARYAGENKNAEDNMLKVLELMQHVSNRKAKFRTVISLIWEGKEVLFQGSVHGSILTKPIGKQGFGYDPIFMPDGFTKSFAEMSGEEKNNISHRGIAIQGLIDYLKELY